MCETITGIIAKDDLILLQRCIHSRLYQISALVAALLEKIKIFDDLQNKKKRSNLLVQKRLQTSYSRRTIDIAKCRQNFFVDIVLKEL